MRHSILHPAISLAILVYLALSMAACGGKRGSTQPDTPPKTSQYQRVSYAVVNAEQRVPPRVAPSGHCVLEFPVMRHGQCFAAVDPGFTAQIGADFYACLQGVAPAGGPPSSTYQVGQLDICQHCTCPASEQTQGEPPNGCWMDQFDPHRIHVTERNPRTMGHELGHELCGRFH